VKHLFLIGIALTIVGCTSVKNDVQETRTPESVPVNLSLSLGGGAPSVKADVSKITELTQAPAFRGISSIRAIPFGDGGAKAGATSLGGFRLLPGITNDVDTQASADGKTYHKGLIENNHAHMYSGSNVALPVGTASLLVYGAAVREAAESGPKDKHLNGSLLESGWVGDAVMEASALTFSPDPILSQESLKEEVIEISNGIADALTSIVNASHDQPYFYAKGSHHHTIRWEENLGSAFLRRSFTEFTNYGQQVTGAGSNVSHLITSLYKDLQGFESEDDTPFMHTDGGVEYPAYVDEALTTPLTYGILYNKLRDALKAQIQGLLTSKVLTENGENLVFSATSYQDFPENLGLPAGSAVLRYSTNLGFSPVTEGLDGVAAMDRFCYMPPLYYFVNSGLSTTTDTDVYKTYTSQSQNWNAILSQYRVGNKVDANTTSVAVDNPLQFAPGLLVLTVKAWSNHLSDNDGDPYTYCTAEKNAFPVTGIIVGSQFTQQFDFTPMDQLSDEFYLYDNLANNVYLTTDRSQELRTLVFPTPKNRDIYFFLELKNDSGSAFYGAEGIIPPDAHFYLAGQITCPDGERVFTNDTFITVNCVVNTLENAHISVPELGDPHLVMGVDANVNWIHSAASYVILD